MKKLLALLLMLSAISLVSCEKNEVLPSEGEIPVSESESAETTGSTAEETTESTTLSMEEEIKQMEETLFDINITAQDVPADCLDIPSDWTNISCKCGVELSVPSDVTKTETSGSMEVFNNADENGVIDTSLYFIYSNDWSETEENGPSADEEEYMKLMYDQLGIPFDGTNATMYDEPLKAAGIDTKGTRYGRVKGLLSVDEKALEGADETTVKAIRWAKGMTFSPFKNAYIYEKDNAHLVIHQYGENDNQYWLNVMPDDNVEHCFMITAPDKETALKIAASAEIAQ